MFVYMMTRSTFYYPTFWVFALLNQGGELKFIKFPYLYSNPFLKATESIVYIYLITQLPRWKILSANINRISVLPGLPSPNRLRVVVEICIFVFLIVDGLTAVRRLHCYSKTALFARETRSFLPARRHRQRRYPVRVIPALFFRLSSRSRNPRLT